MNQFGFWTGHTCTHTISRHIRSVFFFNKPPPPIRFFKKRIERNPHKFYLQQLMLFHPFRDEAELYPDDEDKCINLYLKNEDKIKKAQAQLVPFLESVDEAQKLYQENREKEERGIEEVMGAELDPEMEQEAADGDEEEDEEHPDYYHIDTDQVENGGDGEKRRQIFKAMVQRWPSADGDQPLLSCVRCCFILQASPFEISGMRFNCI